MGNQGHSQILFEDMVCPRRYNRGSKKLSFPFAAGMLANCKSSGNMGLGIA